MNAGPTYRVFGWLFPRGVAAIYLIALLSWKVQCIALVGEHGISPAPVLMQQIREYAQQNHLSAFWLTPGVFWWWSFTDAHLQLLCSLGCVAAGLVMVGVLQGPLLLALWFSYLSLMSTGSEFMGYQWDALLTEAGFIAALLAPWRLVAGRRFFPAPPPSAWQMLLPQALLFKLMFLSGWLKWNAQDSSWRDLTALQYHFETQPLPTWLAWWAHQAPVWCLKSSCALTLIIEGIVPILIPIVLVCKACDNSLRASRWATRFIVGSFIGLMISILLTGNYTFFDWLTILLSLAILDDRCWPRGIRRSLRVEPSEPVAKRSPWIVAPQITLVVALLLLNAEIFLSRMAGLPFAAEVAKFLQPVMALNTVNSYGLFVDMTKQRHELIVEVSDDGLYWQPLEFKWKPGNIKHAPGFVAPHQPRLDWQMWFASLSVERGYLPAWFGRFLEKVLAGQEDVMDLLEPSPVPPDKIRGIRCRFFLYHFTDPKTRRETGAWWEREDPQTVVPPYLKKGGWQYQARALSTSKIRWGIDLAHEKRVRACGAGGTGL